MLRGVAAFYFNFSIEHYRNVDAAPAEATVDAATKAVMHTVPGLLGGLLRLFQGVKGSASERSFEFVANF